MNKLVTSEKLQIKLQPWNRIGCLGEGGRTIRKQQWAQGSKNYDWKKKKVENQKIKSVQSKWKQKDKKTESIRDKGKSRSLIAD